MSVEDFFHAALLVLRPDTAQVNRNQASQYLTEWIQKDEQSLGSLLELIDKIFCNPSASHGLSQFELDGIKGLFAGLFYKRCKSGRYKNNDVKIDTVLSVIDKAILFEEHLVLSQSQQPGEIFKVTLFGSQMCASRCAVAIHYLSFSGDHQPLGNLLVKCQNAIIQLTSIPEQRQLEASTYTTTTALEVLLTMSTELENGAIPLSQSDEILRQCKDVVLNCVRHLCVSQLQADGSLVNMVSSTFLSSLKVLGSWSESTTVTLSDINSSASPQNSFTTILYTLILCLSQQHSESQQINVTTFSSKALSLIILKSPPIKSELQTKATDLLLRSIRERAFLVTPYNVLINRSNDSQAADSLHSLCCLIGAVACEFIDVVASCSVVGCSELIDLCLCVQQSPLHSISITVLEVWLMLQDIPLADRHPNFRIPLFTKVLDVIVSRIRYPSHFTNWDNEFEEDSQEFSELRSLINDVLESIYFLLRIRYVDALCLMASSNIGAWNVMESVLYSFCAVSKEICSQVKSKYDLLTSKDDKELTVERLTHILHFCCADDNKPQHPVLLSAIAKYIGSFTPIWNDSCDADSLLLLLSFLFKAMIVDEASNNSCISIKLIFTGCCDTLISSITSSGEDITSNRTMLSVVSIMEVAQQLNNVDDAVIVAEGCSRFCVKFNDPNMIRQSLFLILCPIVGRIEQALVATSQFQSLSQVDQEIVVSTISSTLRILRELFRFCDGIAEVEIALSDVLNATWPILRTIIENPLLREYEEIVNKISSVYCQLMKTLSIHLASQMEELLKMIVDIFHQTSYPSLLDCVGVSVEVYGNGQEIGFGNLLSSLYHYVKEKELQMSTSKQFLQVASSLFDLTRKYLLYCPGSFMHCKDIESILALAVRCIVEGSGERESSRSAIFFLSQFISCKSLNISPEMSKYLKQPGGLIHSCLRQYGAALTNHCMLCLAGCKSSPQLLWPTITECLVAVIVSANSPADMTGGKSEAQKWVWYALENASDNERITDEVRRLIVEVLFGLIETKGVKSKPMVKMLLTDFAKIGKGEASKDVLLSYGINVTL